MDTLWTCYFGWSIRHKLLGSAKWDRHNLFFSMIDLEEMDGFSDFPIFPQFPEGQWIICSVRVQECHHRLIPRWLGTSWDFSSHVHMGRPIRAASWPLGWGSMFQGSDSSARRFFFVGTEHTMRGWTLGQSGRFPSFHGPEVAIFIVISR